MKLNSRLTAIALAVALCVALPMAAWADEAVTAEWTGEEVLVDSTAVLQEGGFIQAHGTSGKDANPTKLTTQSNAGNFQNALKQAIDTWNGQSSKLVTFGPDARVNVSEAQRLFSQLLNENGQYFYVDAASTGLIYDSSGNVARMTVAFFARYSQSDIQEFKAAADAALAGIQNGWNDEQKALYLHDYLVTHCEYDAALRNYDAYDALVTGSAVCQGYTLAYDYLLKSAGVSDTVITSDAIDHAWNLVTVDGGTYYVDCTWDDPSNVLSEAYCAHDNFLLSKPVFAKGHNSNDWLDSAGANAYANASYGASSTYDSAYWTDTTTAIPSVGSLWAYVESSADSGTAAVKAHDYATGSDITLADGFGARWPVPGNASGFYVGNFTSLASNGEVFVVSTPTELYAIDPNAKSKTRLHELSASELSTGYIYGIFYNRPAEQCVYHLSTAVEKAKTGQGACSLKAASVDSAGYTAGGNTESGGTIPPTDSGTEGSGDTGSTGGASGNAIETSIPPAPAVTVDGLYNVSGNVYLVTSTSAKTVALSAGKNAKSVTVPASVKLADGNTYKVTKIKSKAFASSKATTVTLKTASLTKKSAVKNAFKKSKVKTVKVKVGKASANKKAVKSYKKVLVKSVVGKKVTVK